MPGGAFDFQGSVKVGTNSDATIDMPLSWREGVHESGMIDFVLPANTAWTTITTGPFAPVRAFFVKAQHPLRVAMAAGTSSFIEVRGQMLIQSTFVALRIRNETVHTSGNAIHMVFAGGQG